MLLRRWAPGLGEYSPNEFLIRVSPDHPFYDRAIDDWATPTGPRVAVLFHEYLHYLHNVSTYAGFKNFLIFQSLLGLFSEAVIGRTLETDSTTRNHHYEQLLELLDRLQGVPTAEDDADDLLVVAVKYESWAVNLPGKDPIGGESAMVCVQPSILGSAGDEFICEFGQYAIEEGIAYELEQLVDEAGGGGPLPFPGALPYFLLRRVAEDVVGARLARPDLVRCAILSLELPSPGPFLLRLFERCRDVENPANCIDEAARDLARSRPKRMALVLSEVDDLVRNYSGRGLAAAGMQELAALMREFAEKRTSDPTFELAPFSSGKADLEAVVQLLHAVTPCNAVQEFEGSPEAVARDVLLAFGPDRTTGGFSRTDGLAALQCIVHYLSCHLGELNFLPPPSDDPKVTRCPYYTSCTLEFRVQDAAICRNAPWKRMENDPTCWYGSGAAAVHGLVNIRVLSVRDDASSPKAVG